MLATSAIIGVPCGCGLELKAPMGDLVNCQSGVWYGPADLFSNAHFDSSALECEGEGLGNKHGSGFHYASGL